MINIPEQWEFILNGGCGIMKSRRHCVVVSMSHFIVSFQFRLFHMNHGSLAVDVEIVF